VFQKGVEDDIIVDGIKKYGQKNLRVNGRKLTYGIPGKNQGGVFADYDGRDVTGGGC
jgi:hypothetical protein